MDGKKLYGCERQVFHGVSIPAELVHLIGSLLLSTFRLTVNVTIPYHRYLCNVGRHRRSKGGGGRRLVVLYPCNKVHSLESNKTS